MLLDGDLLAEDLRARAERANPRGAEAGGRGLTEPSALVSARDEAEQLASGRELDEPAALFFALARRSRALGALATGFVPGAARAQALAIGHELVVEDIELTMLRVGVLRGELRFDDIRRWFANSLRPLRHDST